MPSKGSAKESFNRFIGRTPSPRASSNASVPVPPPPLSSSGVPDYTATPAYGGSNTSGYLAPGPYQPTGQPPYYNGYSGYSQQPAWGQPPPQEYYSPWGSQHLQGGYSAQPTWNGPWDSSQQPQQAYSGGYVPPVQDQGTYQEPAPLQQWGSASPSAQPSVPAQQSPSTAIAPTAEPVPIDRTVYVRDHYDSDGDFYLRSRAVIKAPDDKDCSADDKTFANDVWGLAVALQRKRNQEGYKLRGKPNLTAESSWKESLAEVVKSYNSRANSALRVVSLDNDEWFKFDHTIRGLNLAHLPKYASGKSEAEKKLVNTVSYLDTLPEVRKQQLEDEAKKAPSKASSSSR